MSSFKEKFSIHIGMRNIKTALATTFTALIYFLIDRNPTFACIGTIFGIGSDMSNSRLNGGNRFFGTIFGGVLGMALFSLYVAIYPDAQVNEHKPLMFLLLAVGVSLLILVSVGFNWPGAIQPGGVMLCILLFNTPVETYISYSLNRMVDTGAGVLIALGVNLLFPRDRVIKIMKRLNIPTEEA